MRFYISSTYSDLKEHRHAAIAAFREFAENSKHQYDLFDPENADAKGTSPVDTCLHEVRESDYFVLILGWRYGYVPEHSEKSILELEYEAAVANEDRAIFCFMIDEAYPISPKYIETGTGADKLKHFKTRLQQKHIVRRFSTPADLARELTLALSILNQTIPLGTIVQAFADQSLLKREHHQYRDEVKVLKETVDFYKEKLERIVPADPIWKGRKFGLDSSLCFVLMPFSDQFFLQYEEAILPALEAAGLRGSHAGEIFGTREIMEDIWESLCVSRLVIADVTGRNANVFYELGIAHTLGKECVVLTQNPQDVPFDISARRYIRYEPTKLVALRTRLEKTIKNILFA